MLFYIVPLILCLIGYAYKTYLEYKRDLAREEDISFYVTKLTVGCIVIRVVVSVLPIINITALVFDLYQPKIENMWNGLVRLMDKPLVKGNSK